MEDKYCSYCKDHTRHMEDIETFIPPIKGLKIWICTKCWNIIKEVKK